MADITLVKISALPAAEQIGAEDLLPVVQEGATKAVAYGVIKDDIANELAPDATLSEAGKAADAKAVGDALALKADKAELTAEVSRIDAALNTKVNNTTYTAEVERIDDAIATKADAAATTAALATKANANDVNAALATKANTDDVTAALALKADTATVNAGLSLKADKTELTAGLATKQNVLTFDSTPTQGSTNPVTSGGIYQAIPALDETLTVAGDAADAKITGEAITELKNDLGDVNNTLLTGASVTKRLAWENGAIDTTTGEDSTSAPAKNTRCSFFEVQANTFKIVITAEHRFMLFYYDENGAFKTKTAWKTATSEFNNTHAKYRILFQKVPNTNITVDEAYSDCYVSVEPDWVTDINALSADLDETDARLSAHIETSTKEINENKLKSINHWNIGNSDKVVTPTYDGSGEATHPSIVFAGVNGYLGYKWWLGITPYPASQDEFEDPQILVSNDGITFDYFPGCPNPLDKLSAEDIASGAHNCDIDICLVNDTMYCFWLYAPGDGAGHPDHNNSILYERHTTDGVNWSVKRAILTNSEFETDHHFFASPAFVYEPDSTKWKMWFVSDVKVDGNDRVWYTECASDFSGWSEPITVSFGSNVLVKIWHLDVIKTATKYELVGCGYQLADGYSDGWNHQRLFFSSSSNGLTWENLREFMHRRDSQTAWDNKSLYRPSFCYDNRGNCHLFYGASTLGYSGTTERDAAWGIGHAVGANPTAVVGLKANGEKMNAITLLSGSMILDRVLNKPIWRNAGNLMWIAPTGREIDNYWTNYNYIGMTWEQGGISTTDGTDVNDAGFTKQIRTRLFNSLYPLLQISIATGYRAMLFKYTNGAYQSRTSWITETTTVTNEFMSYRLMITPTDSSTLSAANGDNVCKVYEQ